MTSTRPEGLPPAPATPAVFAGVHPVLHLPLTDEGVLDPDGLVRQVEHLIAFGATGIVTVGLATESALVSEDERALLCSLTMEAVGDRVPVTVGIDGRADLALRRAELALALGAAGLMVRPPDGLTRDETVQHFVRLARDVDAPVLVQDAPQATGVELPVDTLCEVFVELDDRSGVKVEAPDARFKVKALSQHGIPVVSGWGGVGYVDALFAGAVGCMPGGDLGPAFVAVDALARAGDLGAARALYALVEPLLLFESRSLELLVISSKRALHRAGVLPNERTRMSAAGVATDDLAKLDALFAELSEHRVPGW